MASSPENLWTISELAMHDFGRVASVLQLGAGSAYPLCIVMPERSPSGMYEKDEEQPLAYVTVKAFGPDVNGQISERSSL
ncbi:MAG TPA: hypothetical protein VKP30_03745 [Polyangiaceae bacterium]|nr:hypothetical protein [Polyangiaceae bacterium]